MELNKDISEEDLKNQAIRQPGVKVNLLTTQQGFNEKAIPQEPSSSLHYSRPSFSKRPTLEKIIDASDGCCMTFVNFILFGSCTALVVISAITDVFIGLKVFLCILFGIMVLVSLYFCCGVTTISPNEGLVVLFCGKYKGTVKSNGCLWILPFFSTRKISFKSNNFETAMLKINDKGGNPIEVGAVITWKIFDSYAASFVAHNLFEYVKCQSESAIRKLVSRYYYDKMKDNETCLKDGSEEIHTELILELQKSLERAGVLIEEAKFNNMAYSSEIAEVMLKRQQAESIIAAREKIIYGAVGMVGMAVDSLQANRMEEMSREEKVKIISNLLVVMCSESGEKQPSAPVPVPKQETKVNHYTAVQQAMFNRLNRNNQWSTNIQGLHNVNNDW